MAAKSAAAKARARAYDRKRARDTGAERRAAGLCPGCGTRKPARGHSRCRRCMDYQAEWFRKRRGERIAAGKCGQCGKRPALKDATRCMPCAVKNALGEQRRRRARKAEDADVPLEVAFAQQVDRVRGVNQMTLGGDRKARKL